MASSAPAEADSDAFGYDDDNIDYGYEEHAPSPRSVAAPNLPYFALGGDKSLGAPPLRRSSYFTDETEVATEENHLMTQQAMDSTEVSQSPTRNDGVLSRSRAQPFILFILSVSNHESSPRCQLLDATTGTARTTSSSVAAAASPTTNSRILLLGCRIPSAAAAATTTSANGQLQLLLRERSYPLLLTHHQ